MTARNPARRSRAAAGATAGLLALAGSLVVTTPAAAAPQGCDNRTNNSVEKLLECVTLEGVREHLEAFQGIADAHGDTRASGTPGYDASADYVAEQAAAAGLEVSRQEFEFPFFQLNGSTFAQTAPTESTYAEGTDYAPMTFTAPGDVTGVVQAVDLTLPPGEPNSSTSGCEAADFAGFTAGNVALMQRGTCAFGQKVANAAAAGAVAAIVFNEGQEGRTELLQGTLGAPGEIPAIGTTFALGSSLGGATVRISVDSISEVRTTENVFAETTRARTDAPVVMVGAHLDSVVEGPGINDNGTGSAAILEVAQQIAKAKPEHTIRFAWWGAEELGLLGSEHYVASLSPEQQAGIGAYLNFDMVGSPNFVRFIYDGDDSDMVGAGPGPDGSGAIEDVFEKFFADRVAAEGTDFTGRSDYGPFIAVGIPSGGLFTGAEGVKTPEQAATYGGTAGLAYDPCYHQACDTIKNVDDTVLDQNADAIAYATLTLASGLDLGAGAQQGGSAPGDGGTGGGGDEHSHGGVIS
ncbi:M20/M25/M40 family metallo-hydrolase [Pseudonocardia nigra]|uniref:M20/M25/M40 family metallo-hydrolase n=1 Tax=Pseudonocardia nigra TaxID=1921578 RepID=UPI001C5D0F29|nr:M20/M25/M40 family metallo-hydrolase [Pseudonocardia nigra]